MAIERWELKVKNKQNIFGDWQLDIIKVKSDPTFFSGDLQLVIETEKPKKVNHQLNHQSPGEPPITKKKVKTLFCVNHQSPITRNLRAGWKSGGQFQLGHWAESEKRNKFDMLNKENV